eukprot:g9291.t1
MDGVKEENRQLKEVMRFMLTKIAAPEEIPEAVADLVKEDPRESIKMRQKELNAERKSVNKLMKVREQINKKEQKYQSWKHEIQDGLQREEKRHAGVITELQQQLKALEREKDGVDPILIDSDGDEEAPGGNGRLRAELTEVKSQMQEFVTYTTQMEAKNAMILEQLQVQMMGLVGALQGSTLTARPPIASPEQEVKQNRKTLGLVLGMEKSAEPGTVKVKEELHRGRSRSPTAEHRQPKIPKVANEYESTQLKTELMRYPEECQMAVLQMIQEAPESYRSWASVQELIVSTHNRMLMACVDALEALPWDEN